MDYREQAPPARLTPYVECFWSLRAGSESIHRVLPDGCMDIVYSQAGGLLLAGSMTRFRDFVLEPAQWISGVRFHPAMARLFVRLPAHDVTDKAIELNDHCLALRISGAESDRDRISIFDEWLTRSSPPSVVQRLATHARERGGSLSVDHLADLSGLSVRHFRRLCLEQAGLTPKQLCRVLRFRRAANLAARVQRGDWATLAIDCGYYDQAHFIREFHAFSGYTPAEYGTRLNRDKRTDTLNLHAPNRDTGFSSTHAGGSGGTRP